MGGYPEREYLARSLTQLVKYLVAGAELKVVHLLRFTGRALSFALRLRNKNNGTSHTHTPKKVAISAKPGTSGACLGYDVRALCLASWVIFAKWKNQRKWSTMTNTHDAIKLHDASETIGQLGVKFCR